MLRISFGNQKSDIHNFWNTINGIEEQTKFTFKSENED